MKQGKELKIDTYKHFNIVYGGVNNKSPKALYIQISAWGEPLQEGDVNYSRVIKDIDKKIRQLIYNSLDSNPSTPFLKERTITDFEIKKSGIKFGKRSFVSCELTFYLKYEIPINSDELKPVIDDLTDTIIKSGLEDNKFFKFYRKKN